MDMPETNLKDYIVKCRQSGMVDSLIESSLKNTGWPEDIIEKGKQEADLVVPQVLETQSEQKQDQVIAQKDSAVQEKAVIAEKAENTFKDPVKKEKKQFSLFGLVAFLLSPIPLIGMVVCMIAADYIQKKKMSGLIFPILGMIINIGLIVYIVWTIFVVILPSDGNLAGFAGALNDAFNFISI